MSAKVFTEKVEFDAEIDYCDVCIGFTRTVTADDDWATDIVVEWEGRPPVPLAEVNTRWQGRATDPALAIVAAIARHMSECPPEPPEEREPDWDQINDERRGF